MSEAVGSAWGGSEIIEMAVGELLLNGAALGGVVIWNQGSVLYELISHPTEGTVNEPISFTVSCNRVTNYLLTYTVASGNEVGVTRTITGISDTADGKRQISFSVSFSTAGIRTLRIYGIPNQSDISDYRSTTYIDTSIILSK